MKAPELPPRELWPKAEDILADMESMLRLQRVLGVHLDPTIAGLHARERRRVKRARTKARRRAR